MQPGYFISSTLTILFLVILFPTSSFSATSKNPMAIAAAAVHWAIQKNNEKVSQLKISEASGISAVTIRDRTKEIKKKLGGEI